MEETKEKTPEEQLEYFCAHCWEDPEKLYQDLWDSYIFHLPKEKYQEMIPKLVDARKHFMALVVLAEHLFNRLNEEERKQLKFKSPSWTPDEKFIDITEAEYKWCKKHGKPCKRHRNRFGLKNFHLFRIGECSYTRPAEICDFDAYDAILRMLSSADHSDPILV